MRKHNGMRPQDIVILTELLVNPGLSKQKKDLGIRLHISQSEISESLNRSVTAGLVSDRLNVFSAAFIDFITHGLKYVFPIRPGSLTKGIATAHSHSFVKEKIVSQVDYVWPDFNGSDFGLAIEPFYPKQIEAVKQNPNLRKALALLDILRVGRNREISVALNEINLMFNHATSQ